MAGEDTWSPKTRDDWVGIFKDATRDGMNEFMSAREEAEAKARAAEEAEKAANGGNGENGTGENEGSNGGSNDDSKRPNAFESFAARLLG